MEAWEVCDFTTHGIGGLGGNAESRAKRENEVMFALTVDAVVGDEAVQVTAQPRAAASNGERGQTVKTVDGVTRRASKAVIVSLPVKRAWL